MGLPFETLEQIQETAVQAAQATVLNIPGDGRKAYVQINGKVQEYAVSPACRKHFVMSLADLLTFSRDYEPSRPAGQQQGRQVIWHNPVGVILVLDDEDRRDRVVFNLTPTVRFQALKDLAKNRRSLDLREFRRLLKIVLGVDPVLVNKFSKLDFSTAAKTTREAAHTQDRMGKIISQEVTGEADIPEELVISTPLYQETGEQDIYDLSCVIDIDFANSRLSIEPKPDEIEAAERAHQYSLRQRIDKDLTTRPTTGPEVVVYHGIAN